MFHAIKREYSALAAEGGELLADFRRGLL